MGQIVVWSSSVEILLASSELAPFSGQTDLSTLAAALPKGLRGLGHHVVVVSPLYSSIDPGAHSLARRLSTLDVQIDGQTQTCTLSDGRTTGGVDLLFIGHPCFGECAISNDSVEARKAAIVLSQATAAVAQLLDPTPQVVHALGFQAALSLALLRDSDASAVSVLSPHRLDVQGVCTNEELSSFAGQGNVEAALQEDPPGNLLAAGMRSADRVVLDSQASIDALFGDAALADLRAVVGERSSAVSRVIPGVDAAHWNPATDSHLAARFDPANTTGKDQCKSALQYELGLPARPDTPLFVALGATPSTDDLQALEALLRNDVQVAVGIKGNVVPELSSLTAQYDDMLKTIDIAENDALHRALSASDFLWVLADCPAESLVHLQGLRYGALPVVQASGCAAEVIVDCDAGLATGCGFLFASRAEQLSALQRAVSAYAKADAFEALRVRAMRTDVSWDRAARHMEYIYRSALETKTP